MKRDVRLGILMVIVILGLGNQISAQTQTGRPKAMERQQQTELTDVKADLAKMQSLLNQMQAVFPMVGNPTAPANHELELNIEMWRILINQMQTRIERMEQKQEAGRNTK